MDIEKDSNREAFEVHIKSTYPMGEQLAKDCGKTLCELYSSEWKAWQAAQALAVPEWINVDDRLPNRQVNVLVASKHDFVCIASLTNNHKNNKFYDGDGLAINSITHWMPLPDAPLEQAND